MLNRKFVLGGLVAVVALMGTVSVAATGVSLEGVKCLMVAKKDAQESKAADWKKGKVYFCCGSCLSKFEGMSKEDKAKMAPKANAQLVATKQYVQAKCPMSGGDLNPEMSITVAGAKVGFCCGNCKGKAEAMEGDEQLAALFGAKAFKKAGFVPAEKE